MDDDKIDFGGKGFANVSRRQLLRTSLVSLVLGLGLTAASLNGLGIREALAQEYGGTLALRLSGNPTNFDPLSNGSGNVLACLAPAYNGIVQHDPLDPEKIIGDLAVSWEVSSDGLTHTFNLVQNATFHDGIPMTWSAVVRRTGM